MPKRPKEAPHAVDVVRTNHLVVEVPRRYTVDPPQNFFRWRRGRPRRGRLDSFVFRLLFLVALADVDAVETEAAVLVR
jgi:hypothetical protein